MSTPRRDITPLPPGISLRDAALVDSTRAAYKRNLDKFLRFTRLSLPQLLSLPSAYIDARLSTYFEHDFRSKGSYSNASHTLFGLIFQCPRLKHKLGEARLRLRGWKRLVQHRSHPPLTWELTVVFATLLAKWGRHAEAVATLLAFDCYLRVSEIVGLRYSDVVMPGDPRTGSAHTGMALRLAVTKTGPNQWVSLRRNSVAQLLLAYLRAFPFLASSRVFPFSAASFRAMLHQVADSLGLGHIPYVPHSLRHGGATCDYLLGSTIEQIMFRGRWVSMESARRYIQTARALLIVLDIPRELHDAGLRIAPQVDTVVSFLLDAVPAHRPVATGRRVRFQA